MCLSRSVVGLIKRGGLATSTCPYWCEALGYYSPHLPPPPHPTHNSRVGCCWTATGLWLVYFRIGMSKGRPAAAAAEDVIWCALELSVK
jgi:hypothetical protein